MERLLELKRIVNIVTSEGNTIVLSCDDWGAIEMIVPLLNVWRDAATNLSAEKYPTLGIYLLTFRALVRMTEEYECEDNTILYCMKKAFVDDMERRMNPTIQAITAAFLDPRLKETELLLDEEREEAKKWIIEQLIAQVPITKEVLEPPKKLQNVLSRYRTSRTKTQLLPRQLIEKCLCQYEELEAAELETNPLECLYEQLPLLAGVARMLLCVPASSAPSERVFSTAGRICTPLRASMKGDLLEARVIAYRSKTREINDAEY